LVHIMGLFLASGISFDTSIQIRVTFTNSSGALIANSENIALDTVSTCSESDSLVTFTNLGCDTITVTADETSWQPGWSADDPTFPFTLAPDSSFTVRIHFKPGGPVTSY